MPSFGSRLSRAAIRAVATFVATAARPSSNALALVPDGRSVSSCAGRDFLCLRQAFGNLAYYRGPQFALHRLAAAAGSSAFVATFCHQIAHAIGHAAYARYAGNTAKALSEGGMTCGSGYYHGVVERAFSGVRRSEVPVVARHLCSGQPKGASLFARYQCVHGLGHGLMIYSADDLPYALSVCDSLLTRWDQESCVGGVFMQNFLTGPMAMFASRYLKPGDLLYPCDSVAERDMLYCYLQVTSRILPAVNYNWRSASAWRNRARTAWRSLCFQSLGRDISGFEREQPRPISGMCRAAGHWMSDCIYGAVRDIADNDAAGKRAAQLCRIVPAAIRSRCFDGVGSILGTLRSDAIARRRACAVVTPPMYRTSCDAGAGLARQIA